MSPVTANTASPDTRNAEDTLDEAFAPMRAAMQAEREAAIASGAFEVEAESEWEHHGSSPKHGGTCTHTYPNGNSKSSCCDEDLPCGFVHHETAKTLVRATRNGAWVGIGWDSIYNVCQECRCLFYRKERRHVEWIEDPDGDWTTKDGKTWRKVVTRSVRNDAKFCSSACRQKAYRHRKVAT